ncbi:cytochrome P450 [Serendipita vermifera]|nr:cytochrome P450 [Serendipita vermifera]
MPIAYGQEWSHVLIPVTLIAGIAALRGILSTPGVEARRAGAKLPPGPKRDPFIGNFRNFPKVKWYETFTRWKREYGDLVYVNLVGTPIVICNSLEVAEELTGKRMNIYSERPYNTMTHKLMDSAWNMALAPPDHGFTEQRKVLRKAIGAQSLQDYDGLILAESAKLVEAFSGFSGDPSPVVLKSVGAIVIVAGYGEKVYQEHGQELVDTSRQRSRMVTWVLTKVWLVDIFPILQYIPSWFPGASFHRVAKEGKHVVTKVRLWAFDMVEKDVKNGVADESITSKYINDPSVPNEYLRDAIAMMYSAGSDTSTTSITNFFFALILHPEVQRKVHEELDKQVGGGRCPTMNEIRGLEYFNAAWNESMRWTATVPLGLPHVSTQADVWRGYYIPKGTIVHCNIGCILRDPRIWGDDAATYNPNRFLPEFNPRAKELPDMLTIPFGFGRRLCPGRHFAERMTLSLAAAVLSTYEVVPVKGETISVSMPFDDSVIQRPSNFRCAFIQRH